jgi:hypothetical protein
LDLGSLQFLCSAPLFGETENRNLEARLKPGYKVKKVSFGAPDADGFRDEKNAAARRHKNESRNNESRKWRSKDRFAQAEGNANPRVTSEMD